MTAKEQGLPEWIVQAVARGWCSPGNSHKVMDEGLAFAIAAEVAAALASDTGERGVDARELLAKELSAAGCEGAGYAVRHKQEDRSNLLYAAALRAIAAALRAQPAGGGGSVVRLTLFGVEGNEVAYSIADAVQKACDNQERGASASGVALTEIRRLLDVIDSCVLLPRDPVAALPFLHALSDAAGLQRLPDPNEDGYYPITGQQSTVRQWYDAILRALTQPQPVEGGEKACTRCKGSGEVLMLSGSGEDAYESPVDCIACDGTGSTPPESGGQGEAVAWQISQMTAREAPNDWTPWRECTKWEYESIVQNPLKFTRARALHVLAQGGGNER